MSESTLRQQATVLAIVSPVGGRSTGDVLHAALNGDSGAWNAIIDQHTNLIWWVARSYRLDDASAADLVQTVWLQLVQHGQSITNGDRLPAWLATTARREAQRRVTQSKRQIPTVFSDEPRTDGQPGPEERLLDDEATAAALAAFHELGPSCQRLLSLLCEVPARSYEEISALLDMPVGSIGPTRQRCLTQLRTAMRGRGF